MWLIVSDTHDNLAKVDKIVELALRVKPRLMIHCGDVVAPFVIPRLDKAMVSYMGVFGNNDGDRFLLSQRSSGRFTISPRKETIEGKSVLIMHEPFMLEEAKRSGMYDFIFFGHTHELLVEKHGDTLVINPGEACGYLSGRATVVLVDPDSKTHEIVEL